MTLRASFGPRIDERGITFRLWAPAAKGVDLMLDTLQPMQSIGNGWYELQSAEASAGTLYKFRIDGLEVADPASAFQPGDVFGRSEVVDHGAYAWRCADWRGRPWHEAVFSEIHVGTFTPEGTFRAAIDRLDHLVETGITALEIMPVADFPGTRNWGYDGVLWYAPDGVYGRPDDLRALVDAAHARGLMVFLDVVYNHFGPEGNYISAYAPALFTEDHHTPWGAAIDYRVPDVRAFAIENALHWLQNYRLDGLRLDAVHAIVEPGERHMLEDLSREVGKLAATSGRLIHLVLENDDNVASLLDPATTTHAGKYRAQWNDDHHHAWHVLLTGETGGYYGDYAEAPIHRVARALESGFVYQGEPSAHRKGAPRGEPSGALPPTAFVNFLQNHDQIGNRAYGERLLALASAPAIEAALAVTLLAPAPPMLFMGEEWGATQPFPFFCDFQGDLADAVRQGRKAEFEAAFVNIRGAEPIPDPISEETFWSAKLDWQQREQNPHAQRWRLVRDLLAARRKHIVPRLAGVKGASAQAHVEGAVLSVRWRLADGSVLALLANLTDTEARRRALPVDEAPAETLIWGGKPPDRLPAWSVYWSIGRA